MKLSSSERARKTVQALTVVVTQAVKDAHGGIAGFCEDYGRNYNTVATKLRLSEKGTWLNLAELEDAIEYTGDERIAYAVCKPLNAVPVFLGGLESVESQEGALAVLSDLQVQMSELSQQLSEALKDGKIDAIERSVLEKCARDVTSAVWRVPALGSGGE